VTNHNTKAKLHRTVSYWVVLLGILFFVIHEGYLDVKHDDGFCQGGPTTKADAYLALRELDADAKTIKASIFVPNLRDDDKLVISTVTRGPSPNTFELETVLDHPPLVREHKLGNWLSLQLPYQSQDFLYPFEKIQVNLHIDFEKKKEPTQLGLQVRNRIVELVSQPCSAHFSFERKPSEPNDYSFVLRRPRFVRAIACVLYTMAFSFLMYILRHEETSKVLANSLGYMAALWGIRQIIVGSVKVFPTIVDMATLFLYLAVAAIIFYRWFAIKPFENPLKLIREHRGHR